MLGDVATMGDATKQSGILQRAIHTIFDRIEETAEDELQFSIYLSIAEARGGD